MNTNESINLYITGKIIKRKEISKEYIKKLEPFEDFIKEIEKELNELIQNNKIISINFISEEKCIIFYQKIINNK